MKKKTFKHLLAGDYDNGRYVTLATDKELLVEMRSLGWWAWSRPLIKNDISSGVGTGAIHEEGSAEWNKDIRTCLHSLGR